MTTMESGEARNTAAAFGRPSLGWWHGDAGLVQHGADAVLRAIQQTSELAFVLDAPAPNQPDEPAVAFGGEASLGRHVGNGHGGHRVLAVLAPLSASTMGDPAFLHCHGVKYPYMTGAMANGIASADIVIAMGKAGMLGSFGAAGLSLDRVDQNITKIQTELGGLPYCVNLIHSPNEPRIEQAVMELFLRRGVRLIEASAYLSLTPMLVQYRLTGLTRGSNGYVVARNRIIGKVSRREVGAMFMQPAPKAMVDALLAEGKITADEAALSREISMADDVVVEADSGGHTDNRPLVALLPIILRLRDTLQTRGSEGFLVRVGAAGGIATPQAVAAAFSMGAAFVLTGSINQAAVESGVSAKARAQLCGADMADVMMAPAADMFEMGVKVQVLKRGTMFAMRAQKLYEIYRQFSSMQEIPAAERQRLETQMFRRSLDEVWTETQAYWQKMDPRQLVRAAENPKHQMALCFRWYLGLASRWAITGDESRAVDFQIWCGPGMGAFNDWVKGSALEPAEARQVVPMAHNLLEGAAQLMRAENLRAQGIQVPDEAFHFVPRAFANI